MDDNDLINNTNNTNNNNDTLKDQQGILLNNLNLLVCVNINTQVLRSANNRYKSQKYVLLC